MNLGDKLQQAFLKSGMSPQEFYNYLVETRHPIKQDDKNLALKVLVRGPGYEDLEWFGFLPQENRWAAL